MTQEFLQVECIFKFFEARIKYATIDEGWVVPWYSTSTYYDDGEEFVSEFLRVSPGRTPDSDWSKARARLNKRLKIMTDDGWMERFRQANQIEYHGEAKWQFVYRPRQFLLRDWRENGGSPTRSAKQYLGIKDEEQSLLRDANGWYSGPQVEEMAYHGRPNL